MREGTNDYTNFYFILVDYTNFYFILVLHFLDFNDKA